MTTKETIGWFKIIRADLKNFPEISNGKKIEALSNAIDIAEAYDSFKKDYEKQLKADLVAILTEIQTEIDELYSYCDFDEDTKTCYNMVRLEEVQWVIDKYKEESEEEE